MTLIPAKFPLLLFDGSTFDETWEFWRDEAQTEPEDFTGCTAELVVSKDFDTAALLTLSTTFTPSSTTPPDGDGLVLDGQTIRPYARAVTIAGLDHNDFTDEGGVYTGVWHVKVTRADGKTVDRYAGGKAKFFREVGGG